LEGDAVWAAAEADQWDIELGEAALGVVDLNEIGEDARFDSQMVVYSTAYVVLHVVRGDFSSQCLGAPQRVIVRAFAT
jgi:hypothetical protein